MKHFRLMLLNTIFSCLCTCIELKEIIYITYNELDVDDLYKVLKLPSFSITRSFVKRKSLEFWSPVEILHNQVVHTLSYLAMQWKAYVLLNIFLYKSVNMTRNIYFPTSFHAPLTLQGWNSYLEMRNMEIYQKGLHFIFSIQIASMLCIHYTS